MVRTECQLCGKSMFIQALRSHTKKNHEVSISDYKEKFRFELVFHWIKFYLNLLTKRRNIMVCLIKVTIDNVHRVDILEKVYHQCGICGELMLHDKYDSFFWIFFYNFSLYFFIICLSFSSFDTIYFDSFLTMISFHSSWFVFMKIITIFIVVFTINDSWISVTLWPLTCISTSRTPTASTMSSSWSELLTGVFICIHRLIVLRHIKMLTGCSQRDQPSKRTRVHLLKLLLNLKSQPQRQKLPLLPIPPNHL